MKEALGLDVGGVIIENRNNRFDTSLFGSNFLNTPAVTGAFEGIRSTTAKFGQDVYIVSKAGPKTQRRTLAWMDHNGFFDQTGVNRENVHFVLNRSDKADVARDLSLTSFVDDRLEVLSHLLFVPNRYLFKPDSAEVARFSSYLADVTRVEDWASLTEKL